VVDRPHLALWELRDVVALALGHGYKVEIATPATSWARDPAECAKRSSAGMTAENLAAMADRFESAATVADLLIALTPLERLDRFSGEYRAACPTDRDAILGEFAEREPSLCSAFQSQRRRHQPARILPPHPVRNQASRNHTRPVPAVF